MSAARAKREATRDRLAAVSLARLNAPDPAIFQGHAAFALHNLSPLTTRPDQIKALRQTILNLAVRGRLVEQDRNDEPGSELLKRIIDANEASAKKGRNRGHANGADVADDSPFDLPFNWVWTSLGQIASGMRYGTSKKCGYEVDGTPVLRIPNVSNGTVDLTDLKFGVLSLKESDDLSLYENDLLIIRSNGSLEIVGRAATVPLEAVGMSFAGYLVRVRLSKELLDARFIWRVTNSQHVRDLIEKPIRSTVGLKNVNSTELSALSIPLPPLVEQHRIVTKVDELMALCDRLETSLTIVDATRRRLLDALLHEALAPGEEREEAA